MAYAYPTMERPQLVHVIRWRKDETYRCERCDGTGQVAVLPPHDMRKLKACEPCHGSGATTQTRDGLLHYRTGELKTFVVAKQAEDYATPMRNDPRWKGYTFMVETFVVVQ